MSATVGTVWICPADADVPHGRLADPASSVFWASWQPNDEAARRAGLVENVEIVGADAAIAWGRERSDVVRIRLGHHSGTYFSAGADQADAFVEGGKTAPRRPPAHEPDDGWWISATP